MTVNQIFRLINNPELLNEDTLTQLKNLVDEYPYFQTIRLLYLKNLQLEKDLSFPVELRKTAIYSPDRKKLYFWIEKNKFESLDFDSIETENRFSPFEVINHFLTSKPELPIENAPDLEHIKQTPVSSDYVSFLEKEQLNDNFSPFEHQQAIDSFLEKGQYSLGKFTENTDSSENSIQETGKTEFFSETLAKIYIKQHKYEKAIQIIRNLSLQYPEKSAYFADQIEMLKKKITNNINNI